MQPMTRVSEPLPRASWTSHGDNGGEGRASLIGLGWAPPLPSVVRVHAAHEPNETPTPDKSSENGPFPRVLLGHIFEGAPAPRRASR